VYLWYGNQSGLHRWYREKHEETDFHRIVAFGKLAELCDQLIRKGRKVYAEGRLHSHTWTDNEGHQRAVTEIILSEMTLLDKKPEDVAVPVKLTQPADREHVGTTAV
jgi:single-strand DNA-binding protein